MLRFALPFFFFCLSLSAQEAQLDYRPAKGEKAFAFPSPTGLTLLFNNGYNLRCFVLNDQLQVLRRVEASLGHQFVSRTRLGFLDQGDRLLILYEESGGGHHLVSLGKFAGDVEEYPLSTDSRGKESWLGSAHSAGCLTVVKLLKKSNQIRLYRLVGARDLAFYDYDLSDPKYGELLKSSKNGRLPIFDLNGYNGDTISPISAGCGPDLLAFFFEEEAPLPIEVDETVETSFGPEVLTYSSGVWQRSSSSLEEQLTNLKGIEHISSPNSPSPDDQTLQFLWKGIVYRGVYDPDKKRYCVQPNN